MSVDNVDLRVVLIFQDPETNSIHRLIGHSIDNPREVDQHVKAMLEEWRDGCTLPLNYKYLTHMLAIDVS